MKHFFSNQASMSTAFSAEYNSLDERNTRKQSPSTSFLHISAAGEKTRQEEAAVLQLQDSIVCFSGQVQTECGSS